MPRIAYFWRLSTLSANQAPIDSSSAARRRSPNFERQGRQLFIANDCAATAGPCSATAPSTVGVRPASRHRPLRGHRQSADTGAFRTPANIGAARAHMHDGRFATLEVVDFYHNPSGDSAPTQRTPRMPAQSHAGARDRPARFFLQPTISPSAHGERSPPFERPHLYGIQSRAHTAEGTPLAGSNGLAPRLCRAGAAASRQS